MKYDELWSSLRHFLVVSASFVFSPFAWTAMSCTKNVLMFHPTRDHSPQRKLRCLSHPPTIHRRPFLRRVLITFPFCVPQLPMIVKSCQKPFVLTPHVWLVSSSYPFLSWSTPRRISEYLENDDNPIYVPIQLIMTNRHKWQHIHKVHNK